MTSRNVPIADRAFAAEPGDAHRGAARPARCRTARCGDCAEERAFAGTERSSHHTVRLATIALSPDQKHAPVGQFGLMPSSVMAWYRLMLYDPRIACASAGAHVRFARRKPVNLRRSLSISARRL